MTKESDGLRNFSRLRQEGFSKEDAYINSQPDPEKAKEILESAKERKERDQGK